jgi:hypothetical protein
MAYNFIFTLKVEISMRSIPTIEINAADLGA